MLQDSGKLAKPAGLTKQLEFGLMMFHEGFSLDAWRAPGGRPLSREHLTSTPHDPTSDSEICLG